jgi:ribosomal protein S12 methylthiotransferase accessory factor
MATFGVTRVTDITRLDRIGCPVFAAIRPAAADGSLAVSCGKGFDRESARVGALCEAIELACAEPLGAQTVTATHRDLAAVSGADAYDFGVHPNYAGAFAPTTELDCVEVAELNSGAPALVPAALIYLPFRGRAIGAAFLGSSNGLASGNTRAEAAVHALLELIERDALSFANALPVERRVTGIKAGHLADLVDQLDQAGLRLDVTSVPSVCGLPVFVAYLFDRAWRDGVSVARGQGCHADRAIALNRAVSEAIQSRLTNIHGGRDDIVHRHARYRDAPEAEERDYRALATQLDGLPTIDYAAISDCPGPCTPEALLDTVVKALATSGFRRQFIHVLFASPAITVVKLVVPGLEYCTARHLRVGKRLIAAMAR